MNEDKIKKLSYMTTKLLVIILLGINIAGFIANSNAGNIFYSFTFLIFSIDIGLGGYKLVVSNIDELMKNK